jgi:N,N'-diacetyllegionaminate synthase
MVGVENGETLVSRFIQVEERRIGDGEATFIIAEAGINHDGSIDKAESLIDMAAKAGADAIKFQTYVADSFVAAGNPLYKVFKANELSAPEDLRRLQSRAEQNGILFFSSATDFHGLERLNSLGVPLYKMSSANLTNLPLMKRVAETGKPVIISTGGATLGEVLRTHEFLTDAGASGVAVLKCTSLYPCADEDAHLRGLVTLRNAIPGPIGFSDHTQGAVAAAGAIALGATIIEKHITLNKSDPGHDHNFSADFEDLSELVRAVRAMEKMLGSPVLKPVGAEAAFRREARRAITALTDIHEGAQIDEAMLSLQRPQDSGGLPPELMQNVIGRTARRSIAAGSSVNWDDI